MNGIHSPPVERGQRVSKLTFQSRNVPIVQLPAKVIIVTVISVPTQRDFCVRLKLFPSTDEVLRDDEIDTRILDYSRSETAFAVISVFLMCLGIIFSIYAVREPRYMFKRLAGILHIMTAICILVSAEVLISSVAYEKQNLPKRLPAGAYIHYGFSFGLAWVVFAIYIIAALINFYYGRKRKRDRAIDEKEAFENEPVHLGRF